jgi:AcrR family transcriptional regulator
MGVEDEWDEIPGEPIDALLDRRRGLPRRGATDARSEELVREIRRMWVLAATAKIFYASGPGAVTVHYVAERAGVTAKIVEELYRDGSACIVATHERGFALAAERTVPRYAAEVDPIERIRTALAQLLWFCESERELASVCVADAAATSGRKEEMVRTLSRILGEELDDHALPVSAREASSEPLEQALALVRERLAERRRERTMDLFGEILELILTEHIGSAAARIEAARSAPRLPAVSGPEDRRGKRPSLDLRLAGPLLRELAEVGTRSRPRP